MGWGEGGREGDGEGAAALGCIGRTDEGVFRNLLAQRVKSWQASGKDNSKIIRAIL